MTRNIGVRRLLLFMVAMLALTGCQWNPAAGPAARPSPSPSPGSGPIATPTETPHPTSTPTPAPTPTPVVTRATLAAIGDVLLHNTVYQDAKTEQGGYDFKPMFALVRDRLRQSDLVVANQESITGGTELGLSSYPVFNSPHEIGDALLDSGIDLVTMANNHAMDMREKGIQSAIAYWNQLGMPYTGAFASQEDRDRIRVLKAHDISFAFLSYTYGTNGIPVPADKPYLVNLIDESRIQADIERARELADIVAVSMHWGIEDQANPNDTQRTQAEKLAAWGADIVIGSHPHVLQPFAWLTRPDGKRTFVMYSLGNFLSAQDMMPELIGGIGQIEVVKTVKGGTVTIEMTSPTFMPTYNKYVNYRHYQIVPFSQLSKADAERVMPVWESFRSNLVAGMPELQIEE